MAEQYPHITVVGIDVLPRVLALAAKNVSESTEAQQLLRQSGLVEIATVPTPPGFPALTMGRKDARG